MHFDGHGRKGLVWTLLAITGIGSPAWAETTIPQEYGKHITSAEAVGAIGTDLFGEQVNLYTGSAEFATTDVSLPGNSSLPVSIGRRFTVESRAPDDQTRQAGMFRDWDLEIPHLHGIFPLYRPWQVFGSDNDLAARVKRCSVASAVAARPPTTKGFGAPAGFFVASEYWQGNHLYVPGQGDQEMLFAGVNNTYKPTDGNAYYWTTQQRWAFSCLPNTAPGNNVPGEAFLAVAPDGTRYRFDWIVQRNASVLVKPYDTGSVGDFAPPEPADAGGDVTPQFSSPLTTALSRQEVWILPTRIEDRFGNYVTYTYDTANPWRLLSIVASDGRQLTLTYNSAGDIHTVTDGTRTWTYGYTSPQGGSLSSVQLPDLSQWTIAFGGLGAAWIKPYQYGFANAASLCEDPSMWAESGQQAYIGTITHPSGAVGEFTFKPTEHGRSYVPKSCIKMTSDPTDPDAYAYQAYRFAAVSLRAKKITGPGLPTYQWNYTYGALNNSWSTCVNCPTTKTVEVAGPGDYRRYTFGNKYGENEGKLLKTETGSGPAAIFRTENTTYLFDATGQAYPSQAGSSPNLRGDQAGERHVPVVQREIIQQGATFMWQVSQTNGVYSFDNYVNPLSVTRSSTLGYTRNDTTAYHHNTAKWVLGQVASTTNLNTGLVESQTDYDANALPWKTYAFGKLQQTFFYNVDGTLGTVKDGNSHMTAFADWKRGIPQTITFADTTFKSAHVDDFGGIEWVRDENGYKTCYAYDPMGRLTGITYPSETQIDVCDTSAWNATAMSFAPSAASAYGLPAGHWRQTTQTGNAYAVTYFDALWRPVVKETYDIANTSATLAQTVTRYDAAGRVTYASYPQRSQTPAVYNTWADPSLVPNALGSWTAYDALGRTTQVQQNSELGPLTTAYAYLTGFQTRVTNPRGYQTTTSYTAYDQPSTDWPQLIAHPEGATTTIARDVFGKPATLSRRNADASLSAGRYYAYDQFQRLCKQTELETGTTAFGYDEAGNLAWSAAALPWSPSAPCQYTANDIYVSPRRVDRTYDARNRLKTLVFPDGQGDQAWNYMADGLPSLITAYNDPGHTGPVITAYLYNARRQLSGQGESISQPSWYSWGIGYAYDRNGSLASHAYPSGLTVTYAPNALGQPTQVGSYASAVSYYPNGAIQQFTYGNGLTHTLTQNARQLPDTSCDFFGSCGASAALNDGYDYDANGNVASISDGRTGQRGNRSMGYDGLDRLTSVVSTAFGNANYSYDVLDNLTRTTIGGTAGRDHYYCYDAQWRLSNVKTGGCGGASVIGLGYDERGNLANKNGLQYFFDFGNRLRLVNGVEYYRYDGLGRRVHASHPTLGIIFSQYTREGQLFYQHNGRTQLSTEYLYLGGSLVATRDQPFSPGAAVVKYQHTDALGSPIAVTDQNRNVIEKSEYEPNGKLLNRPLKDGPGFTGHVSDALTGMSYMQQRYYDPVIGRMLSMDPVTAYSSGDWRHFNGYAYAFNNPYRFTDPDGRQPCCNQGPVQSFEEFGDRMWSSVDSGIFHTAGQAIAADAAFFVGVATDNQALQNVAIEGMRENISAGDGISAATMGARGGGKTFTTYTRSNGATVYSGRTSGKGTPEQQVAARTSRPDHKAKTAAGYGPATVDKSSANAGAIRGREQQLIDQNGGAQSQGGTSGNVVNGVSPTNPKAPEYKRACNQEFGC